MLQDLAQRIDTFMAGVTLGEFIVAGLVLLVAGGLLYAIGSMGAGD